MTGPAIDLTVFNEIRNLMEDSMGEFIHTYLSNSPKLITGMEQGLANTDAEAIYHNAHQLKGGSGSIGAMKLADIAMEIEKIGRAGSTEGLASLLADLGAEFQRVEQELKTLI